MNKGRWTVLWLVAAPLAFAEPGPLIAELYTSQGCSSCPPADIVLENLPRTTPHSIVPLACHVDYWDYLGWKDIYSNPVCTQRQKAWATLRNRPQIFTPQLIVDGTEDVNGGDAAAVMRAIERAKYRSRAALVLEDHTWEQGENCSVRFRLPSTLTSSSLAVTAFVFQDGEPVDVLRGENKGRAMGGFHFVRSVQALTREVSGGYAVIVRIPAEDRKRKTGVAVMVQDELQQVIASGQLYPITFR